MAIIIGSETLDNTGHASFNGTPLRQIIYNGTIVFKQRNCACWNNFIEQLSYDQSRNAFTFKPKSIIKVATEFDYPNSVRFSGTVYQSLAFETVYECAADGKRYRATAELDSSIISDTFDFTTAFATSCALINSPETTVFATEVVEDTTGVLPFDPRIVDAQAHLNMAVSNDPYSGTVSYNVVENYNFNAPNPEVYCFSY